MDEYIVSTNKTILKAYMLLNGDKQEDLAKHLGLSDSAMSAKMNNWRGRQFTGDEIKRIAERYNLSDKAIQGIFAPSNTPYVGRGRPKRANTNT